MSVVHSLEQVEAALRRHHGLMGPAADELGVTRQAVYKRVRQHARLREVVEEARERRVDRAELKFDRAIENGEPWAIALALKTLGKDRGYVERQEQALAGDVTIRVEYVDDADAAAE